MSTKQKLQEQAAKLQAELAKLNKTIASILPEGFVPFEATSDSKCPCHSDDEVEVIREDGVEILRRAGSLSWINLVNHNYNIAGYKIVKKYTEPRPMTFAEIPIGTLFKYESSLTVGSGDVYLKLSNEEDNNAFNIDRKWKDCFSDRAIESKFYEVEANFSKSGTLMTV